MRIPSSFKIAGLTITIEEDNNSLERDGYIGKADFPFQKITLDCGLLPRETVEQAFFHEMVHWILYVMSHPNADNEEFVDVFSHLLYQVMSTGAMLKEINDDA